MSFIFSAECPQEQCRQNDKINCLTCPNCGSIKFKKCKDTHFLTCKSCGNSLSNFPCQVCGTKIKSKEYENQFSRLITVIISLPFLLILGGVIAGITDNYLEEKVPEFVITVMIIFWCLVFPCFISYMLNKRYEAHRKAIKQWKGENSEV